MNLQIFTHTEEEGGGGGGGRGEGEGGREGEGGGGGRMGGMVLFGHTPHTDKPTLTIHPHAQSRHPTLSEPNRAQK